MLLFTVILFWAICFFEYFLSICHLFLLLLSIRNFSEPLFWANLLFWVNSPFLSNLLSKIIVWILLKSLFWALFPLSAFWALFFSTFWTQNLPRNSGAELKLAGAQSANTRLHAGLVWKPRYGLSGDRGGEAFNQSKWEEELLTARLHLHPASASQCKLKTNLQRRRK